MKISTSVFPLLILSVAPAAEAQTPTCVPASGQQLIIYRAAATIKPSSPQLRPQEIGRVAQNDR